MDDDDLNIDWDKVNVMVRDSRLRDYFAAAAMQAYCSSGEWRENTGMYETARCAYAQADAMLKERGNG
jgi:hypothetical protein